MSGHDGNSADLKYEAYSSKDEALSLNMDYIADWRFIESRGAKGSYAQVQFIGKVDGDFAPTFVVTIVTDEKATFEPVSVAGYVDDIVNKRSLYDDFKEVSRTDSTLFDRPAIDLVMSYSQPDRLHVLNPVPVPFTERVIIAQVDGKFYTVTYQNPQASYEKFEEAFLHCLKSLQVKS